MGALVALLHDVLVLLAIFTIFDGWLPFSLDIDQQFIAAALTVMGYSINDTIVIFDRVREYLGLRSEEHTSELQSLMRISYAVFCLKKKTNNHYHPYILHETIYTNT